MEFFRFSVKQKIVKNAFQRLPSVIFDPTRSAHPVPFQSTLGFKSVVFADGNEGNEGRRSCYKIWRGSNEIYGETCQKYTRNFYFRCSREVIPVSCNLLFLSRTSHESRHPESATVSLLRGDRLLVRLVCSL